MKVYSLIIFDFKNLILSIQLDSKVKLVIMKSILRQAQQIVFIKEEFKTIFTKKTPVKKENSKETSAIEIADENLVEV